MRTLAFLLLTAGGVANAASSTPPLAYSAVKIVTMDGRTSRLHVYSDGVHTKTIDEGGGGSYSDDTLKTRWQWGSGYGCIHLAEGAAAESKSARREEPMGNETIDGHPTRKAKVTWTWTEANAKTTRQVQTVWYATDLHDLIIRSESAEAKMQTRLEQIVVGRPDARLIAFPSPPCDAREAMAIATAAPKSAGGARTIRFDQGACEHIVPLPIAMSIPSDYAVRSVRRFGCFWGAEDDLTRMLSSRSDVDFTSIRRGVFWCRVSESTSYDPVSRRFVSEAGPHDKWAETYRGIGAKNVVVTSKPVGAFPSARVTMTANGQRVYMLYLAVPNTDSLAILINYHPAGNGSAEDDAVWSRFVDSVAAVR